MSSKVTVQAAANIAFIKYWGAADLSRAVPYHPSISMTLRRCHSLCTVEILSDSGEDEIWLAGPDGDLTRPGSEFTGRISAHLDRLRAVAEREARLRLATRNSFPSAAGLASSASGFAALTLAVTKALGLDLAPAELSSLARLSGSGSAARSTLGGFVEWPAGSRDEECYAVALAPESHWDLRDVIALVASGPKGVSSLEGHRRAPTSPYFSTRRSLLEGRLQGVRGAIAKRDLEALGPLLEEEAIDLHLIAMSSRPPIFYWQPGTLTVLETVRGMRRDGLAAYATMDAGANVHVICLPQDEEAVASRLEGLEVVRSVIRDGVGGGPNFVSEDLL